MKDGYVNAHREVTLTLKAYGVGYFQLGAIDERSVSKHWHYLVITQEQLVALRDKSECYWDQSKGAHITDSAQSILQPASSQVVR